VLSGRPIEKHPTDFISYPAAAAASVVAIFLIENDLDLYVDGFPFWSVTLSLSLSRAQSFLPVFRFVFFPFRFPYRKVPHARPTSINQTTYSDRRFVYINNIFYLGLLVNISTGEEIYFTIFLLFFRFVCFVCFSLYAL